MHPGSDYLVVCNSASSYNAGNKMLGCTLKRGSPARCNAVRSIFAPKANGCTQGDSSRKPGGQCKGGEPQGNVPGFSAGSVSDWNSSAFLRVDPALDTLMESGKAGDTCIIQTNIISTQ